MYTPLFIRLYTTLLYLLVIADLRIGFSVNHTYTPSNINTNHFVQIHKTPNFVNSAFAVCEVFCSSSKHYNLALSQIFFNSPRPVPIHHAYCMFPSNFKRIMPVMRKLQKNKLDINLRQANDMGGALPVISFFDYPTYPAPIDFAHVLITLSRRRDCSLCASSQHPASARDIFQCSFQCYHSLVTIASGESIIASAKKEQSAFPDTNK